MNKLENKDLIIEVKNTGAELSRIYSKTLNKEFLWNGNRKFWGRHSPILFPIVGRLKDNETIIDEKPYNMNQHGFARDFDFNLIEKDQNSLTYKLASNSETEKYYPYDFELFIKYIITETEIKVCWKVINTDCSDIFFSIGAHPAFNVPFDKETTIDNYYLNFKTRDEVSNYLLQGPFVCKKSKVDSLKSIKLHPEIFKNDALIYDNVDEITISSKNSSTSIYVKFDNFPFVGVWSPYNKEDNTIAPFVCIEPWFGIADCLDSDKIFKNKLGINQLSPNKTFETSYSITINS
ncbi:aldose 1-epimerase family protein [Paraclostridium bifermentans]|uniref:aldose 1-epimerase family protein n=1 Tax=Paraclostridium bifermentans TaxID=1490 RepID=UPI0018AC4621|nr:aldose 1-epimerase family protein [Paraclostridium bifermentans]